jgi:hypothetical protein
VVRCAAGTRRRHSARRDGRLLTAVLGLLELRCGEEVRSLKYTLEIERAAVME